MLRSFAGGDLFGEIWGSPPPRVLALHGWRRTHSDFTGVLGPGSKTGPTSAIALDLPGFGASPPPHDPWGSAEYAALVARVLREGGPGWPEGPVVVLGHSFGGRVAVHLAATDPELVRALVLTGAPVARREGGGRKPPAAFRLMRSARKAHLIPEEMLERARQRYGSADYVAAQGVMRQVLVRLLSENYEDQISRIGCPVELVWGDDDTEAPLSIARAVHGAIPGSILTVSPGAGHMTPQSVPELLRQAVDRALEAPVQAGAC